MEKKKKIAAAMSAVMHYLKTEEEFAIASSQAASAKAASAAQGSIGMWGASGRQSTMQIRNMMQMKAFHGIK